MYRTFFQVEEGFVAQFFVFDIRISVSHLHALMEVFGTDEPDSIIIFFVVYFSFECICPFIAFVTPVTFKGFAAPRIAHYY